MNIEGSMCEGSPEIIGMYVQRSTAAAAKATAKPAILLETNVPCAEFFLVAVWVAAGLAVGFALNGINADVPVPAAT
jgi:hypothetical protein